MHIFFNRGDIIYKVLIQKYINTITTEDIKNFAIKNKMPISDNEALIIYNFIKKYYNEVLNKNDQIFLLLKDKVRSQVYNNIIDLYNKNKTKYLS